MKLNGKTILRVFPRRTAATPDDELAVIGAPTRAMLDAGGYDEIHVSVTFTYDMAEQWAGDANNPTIQTTKENNT